MTPRTRMMLIGVIVPLVTAGAGVVAILFALPTLPDPMAVHWGSSGEPDGFGTPVTAIVLPVIVVLGYSVLAFFVARLEHGVTMNQRIIIAIAPFLALLLTILVVGTTVAQVGLTDARNAPSIFPVLITAVAAALAGGVIAWFVLPAPAPLERTDSVPETLELGPDERATWTRLAEPSRVVAGIVLGILALAIAVGGVALWTSASTAVFVAYLLVFALIAVLAIGSLFWRVTIDSRGARVRSVMGFPRFSIALAEVETAVAIDVDPLRDFGGWGIRWGAGRRMGIVVSGGDALEIMRRNGSAIVVTVPQAQTAAALLNTLVARVR